MASIRYRAFRTRPGGPDGTPRAGCQILRVDPTGPVGLQPVVHCGGMRAGTRFGDTPCRTKSAATLERDAAPAAHRSSVPAGIRFRGRAAPCPARHLGFLRGLVTARRRRWLEVPCGRSTAAICAVSGGPRAVGCLGHGDDRPAGTAGGLLGEHATSQKALVLRWTNTPSREASPGSTDGGVGVPTMRMPSQSGRVDHVARGRPPTGNRSGSQAGRPPAAGTPCATSGMRPGHWKTSRAEGLSSTSPTGSCSSAVPAGWMVIGG